MSIRPGLLAPIFPKQPPKPYIDGVPNIKPAKANSMTIAVALKCETGFVLCADRLMSHGKASDFGSFAHYGKKVFTLEDFNFATVVCGAGDSLVMRAVTEEVLRKIRENQPSNADAVPQILEESLNNVATRLSTVPDLSLVLATAMSDSPPNFIRSDGLIIQPANPVEVLGIGETSLVQYLIDSMFSPEMSLHELAALGVFIVHAAKKYCPQYCGGQTDVCALPRDYFWDIISVEASKIIQLEQLFDSKAPSQLQALLKEAIQIFK